MERKEIETYYERLLLAGDNLSTREIKMVRHVEWNRRNILGKGNIKGKGPV